MGKFEYIVNGIKEMVSEENRNKVQEIFDAEFSLMTKYFDIIYKDASDEQIEQMKLSFVSFLLDKLIVDNKSMENSIQTNSNNGIIVDSEFWKKTFDGPVTALYGGNVTKDSVSSSVATPPYTTTVVNCKTDGIKSTALHSFDGISVNNANKLMK